MERRLDLTGLISPLDLLKCKQVLSTMAEGQVLHLTLTDRDVADTLTTVVERSPDELLYRRERQNRICLGIRKGKGE